MQVGPSKPVLKAPGTKRLKLTCDELLSNYAFKFNLRRYIKGALVVARVVSGEEFVVTVVDLEPMQAAESVGATAGTLQKAEAYFMSIKGLYKISLYAAYDGEGDHAAHKDSDPANRPDAILFRQFSHCNARLWTVLNAENLDACMDPAEEKSAALRSSSEALATTELTKKGKMKLPNLVERCRLNR